MGHLIVEWSDGKVKIHATGMAPLDVKKAVPLLQTAVRQVNEQDRNRG